MTAEETAGPGPMVATVIPTGSGETLGKSRDTLTSKPGEKSSVSFKRPERKSNIVRRLSKRIRRIVDDKVIDERHADETLIQNITGESPKLRRDPTTGKLVTKSTSLNRDKQYQVSMRRRLGSKNHTISKCFFDLKDFDEYSRQDIPALAEHFKQCNDPAHILPIKKEKCYAFSSKPPFVKVKKEDIPDVTYAEESHQEDPEIQKIIDILVKRAEVYNSEGIDTEMRQLVLEADSNMRWYLVHRAWDLVKKTSQVVSWTQMLNMLL